jgi:hypothetical protein
VNVLAVLLLNATLASFQIILAEILAPQLVWQGMVACQGQIFAYYVILYASLVLKIQPTALLARLQHLIRPFFIRLFARLLALGVLSRTPPLIHVTPAFLIALPALMQLLVVAVKQDTIFSIMFATWLAQSEHMLPQVPIYAILVIPNAFPAIHRVQTAQAVL